MNTEENISTLQTLIMSYSEEQVKEMKRQIEEKKMERQTEVNEKEKQMGIKSKIEKTKLQVEKWVQLEKINLNQSKMEFDSKKHTKSIETKIKETKI